MSIQTQIDRLKTAIANAFTACNNKGATMPSSMTSDNLAACIESISGSTPNLGELTLEPSETSEVIFASENGYDGYSKVTKNPVSSDYIGSSITRKAAASYTPTKETQKISAGQYLAGDQTINPIPSGYLLRYDIQKYATGTFQPKSDSTSQTISNTDLGGRTPKIIAFFMTNAGAYKPSFSDSYDYITSGFHCTVKGTVRGVTFITSNGSRGYNNNTDYLSITPQKNGFKIATSGGCAITKEKGYRYYMLG